MSADSHLGCSFSISPSPTLSLTPSSSESRDGFVEVEDDAAELLGGVGVGKFFAELCEEGEEVFPLSGGGFAGKGEEVGAVDLGGVGWLGFEAGGEGFRGLYEGGVVEEGERLLGGVRLETVHGAFLTGGCVEGGEHGVNEGALPVDVEAAAVLIGALGGKVFPLGEIEVRPKVLGLVRHNGRTADLVRVEQAGDGEGVVADELGFEAAGGLLGKQTVVGVDLGEFGVCGGDLAVGFRGDEEAHHVFHIPAGGLEFGGEPVDEFRVGRPLALVAEVIEDVG